MRPHTPPISAIIRAIDLVRRVRRHRIVAEPRRPALGMSAMVPPASRMPFAGTATPSVVRVVVGYGVAEHQHMPVADFVRYAAGRVTVPTSSPIVGVIAGGPVTVTVTGAEKVTLTSIRSPAR